MQSIGNRITALEQKAQEIVTAAPAPDKPCICHFGERSYYFVVTGMTEEQSSSRYPNNVKHCLKCGGLNPSVTVDEIDMEV